MATIRVRKGYLYIDYRDEGGKRHRNALHLKNTRENLIKANLEKKKIEYELGSGVYKERNKRLENRSKTLNEGFDEFLVTKTKRAKSTIEHYKDSFDKIFNYTGDCKIRTINTEIVENIEAELKKSSEEKNGLSDNTIASYFNKLRQIFDFFVSNGYIDSNPIPKRKMKPKEIVTIPEKEVEQILYLLKQKENRKHYRIIFMLLATGLRISEMINLTFDDIDLRRNLIAVKNKKADRIDYIPIYYELKEFIINEFPEREGKVFDYCHKDSLRFFRRFLKDNGFRHYSLHTLRKTYISKLVNSGLSVFDVMTLARHKSIKTTLKHYTAADLKRIGNEISERANMGTFLGTRNNKPLKILKAI